MLFRQPLARDPKNGFFDEDLASCLRAAKVDLAIARGEDVLRFVNVAISSPIIVFSFPTRYTVHKPQQTHFLHTTMIK